MPPPDRVLIERVAGALATSEGLVEKDWHVVRALAVIAAVDHGEMIPVFSGGTSLSKGHQLIKRFSEDIDFKVKAPARATKGQASRDRSAYRKKILDALVAAGFALERQQAGNESMYFSADLKYGGAFKVGAGLRPHIKLEMSFWEPSCAPVEKPIQSLVGLADKAAPEVPKLLCIALVETAADKLSALAWRAHVRDRKAAGDDPSIVRHLHDLAALEPHVLANADLPRLVRETMARDATRADGLPEGPALLGSMLDKLVADKLWGEEYTNFVTQVSYAPAAERISFEAALKACRRLVTRVG